MEKEIDLLTFIGRMQPLHNAHKKIIDAALEKAKDVLILVGSSGKARTIRNPFTFEEREEMIRSVYDYRNNLHIKPLHDKTYNDSAWEKQVQDIVTETALDIVNKGGFRNHGIGEMKIGLIGCAKDHTSYYLSKFPQWKKHSINVDVAHDELSATVIREDYFAQDVDCSDYWYTVIPDEVGKWMENWSDTDEFFMLQKEMKFVRDYKEQWANAPYPVKHCTVDCLVEQSGHVLLVKRKSEPGKGLWALPGGHLNEFEKQMDGAIRELKEETGIKVPVPVLRGNIVNVRTFDDPYRSTLGRVITQAYHIKLPDSTELPRVRGADDAEKARWIPLSELREDMLFDDHMALIETFCGL